jgi:hypothetical protein
MIMKPSTLPPALSSIVSLFRYWSSGKASITTLMPVSFSNSAIFGWM